MTLVFDEDDDETRPRILSNTQILAYIARHWMREPVRFTAACALVLTAAACDLSIPWASKGLIDAVTSPTRVTALAWTAWAALSALYAVQYASRSTTFRILNGLYSRVMARMVGEGSSGCSRSPPTGTRPTSPAPRCGGCRGPCGAMTSASDALVLMLAPALIVMLGLRCLVQPEVAGGGRVRGRGGGCSLYNVTLAIKYIRPANLASKALDSRIGGALADAIGANPVVKSFGAEAREEARFGKVTAQTWRAALNETWDRSTWSGWARTCCWWCCRRA